MVRRRRFTEQTTSTLVSAATIIDVDSANLSSMTVTLTARPDGNAVESLSLTSAASTAASGAKLDGGLHASTGVLSISRLRQPRDLPDRPARRANNNGSDAPTTTDRSVTVIVNDGDNSVSRTVTIGITAVNDNPVLGGAGNTVAYTEQQASAVVINSALTVADADSANLTGATVTISAGFVAGDVLGFGDQNGITGSYDLSTRVLTLSGSTTLANYQTALRSVTFSSTSDHPTSGGNATRTISWAANDGAGATISARASPARSTSLR